jgi:glycosyltransferase involved in cell wall biosynthesis
MRIIIYNSSSFGGCFDYGREIFHAYSALDGVSSCEWWVPENAVTEYDPRIRKIFIHDKPALRFRIFRQLHFLYRSLMNPLLLYLRMAAAPDSVLIFNDFEQLTAPFWVPLFQKLLRRRHQFSVILHDPDRDAYPPSIRWTNYSMRMLMRLMDVAFYHHYLPEKPYYAPGFTHYIDVPHGVFMLPDPDPDFLYGIRQMNPSGKKILSIPGNIRPEKNYHLAIAALPFLPDCILLIAGAASNARVDVEAYRRQAREAGVEDRVLWIEAYLKPAELAAVMAVSDVILLNYADSFSSQSGIFNVSVPFRKPVVVSAGRSSLSRMVAAFGIGTMAEGFENEELAKAIRLALSAEAHPERWDRYLEYASWDRNAAIGYTNFFLAKHEVERP